MRKILLIGLFLFTLDSANGQWTSNPCNGLSSRTLYSLAFQIHTVRRNRIRSLSINRLWHELDCSRKQWAGFLHHPFSGIFRFNIICWNGWW